MARIKTIPFEEATGRLQEVYTDLMLKRGCIANVHTIQSLRPESIVKHMDLYLEIMYSKSKLSRAEREMMAVVVSITNSCEYCQIHHAQALNHYWKDEKRIDLLIKDYHLLDMTNREKLLCNFAEKLTLNPSSFKEGELVAMMKHSDFSDAAILDVVLVVSYFNFVNRIVLSLDVNMEKENQSYNY